MAAGWAAYRTGDYARAIPLLSNAPHHESRYSLEALVGSIRDPESAQLERNVRPD